MNLADKKKDHVDAEAFNLLSLIEDITKPATPPLAKNDSGSINHKILMDLSDKMIDKPHVITEQNHFETLCKKEVYGNRTIEHKRNPEKF